jgi:hypothetical protein
MIDIINHVLNGAIQKAIDELEGFYPAVLLPIPGDGIGEKNGTTKGQIGSNGNNSNTHGNGNGNGNGNGTNPGHRDLISLHEPSSRQGTYGTNAQGAMIWTPRPSTSHESDTIHAPGPPRNLELSTNQSPHSIPTFPNSTHPSHILLNLHIQQFIESFRSIPQTMSPGSSTSSLTSTGNNNLMSMSMSMSMSINPTTANGGGVGGLQHALTAASGLHAEAALLDPSSRAVYVREITDAGALFAYTDPEDSPVSGFLRQERRIVLAEQVNRAILSMSLFFPLPLLHCVPRQATIGLPIRHRAQY